MCHAQHTLSRAIRFPYARWTRDAEWASVACLFHSLFGLRWWIYIGNKLFISARTRIKMDLYWVWHFNRKSCTESFWAVAFINIIFQFILLRFFFVLFCFSYPNNTDKEIERGQTFSWYFTVSFEFVKIFKKSFFNRTKKNHLIIFDNCICPMIRHS